MPAARHGQNGGPGGHGGHGGQVFAFPTGGHAGFDGIGATVSTIADIPGGQGQGAEQPAIIGQEIPVGGNVAGASMAPQLPQLPAPQAPLIPTTLPAGGIPTPLSLGYRLATGAYSVASKVPWWVWLGLGIGATLWWTRKGRRNPNPRGRAEADSDDFDYEDDEEGPIVMPASPPRRRRKNPLPTTTPMALVSASSWPWPPSSWETVTPTAPPISSPFTTEADDDGTE